MAAAIAKRVFGPSHTILSAGAETATGSSATKHAIAAMSEIGIDISEHLSNDVIQVDLAGFDLVVVFRPSAAESITVPQGVRVEYLNVADPYGGPLDAYRSAARSIERGVRRLYVEDALRRAEGSQPSSHLSGIVNRAAKECEKEVAQFMVDKLGQAMSDKATLGQLAKSIRKCTLAENRPEVATLSDAITSVNDLWVKVKHRDDPAKKDLVDGLRAIQQVFKLLEH